MWPMEFFVKKKDTFWWHHEHAREIEQKSGIFFISFGILRDNNTDSYVFPRKTRFEVFFLAI